MMNNGSHSAPWVVIKFGGTSVSNRQCWENIKTIIQQHLMEKKRCLIVCSAASGVSNLLEKLLVEPNNDQSLLATIQKKYQGLADQLKVNSDVYLNEQFSKLEQLIEGVRLIGEVTPRVHARVMAFGELILTHIGALYLNKHLENNGINVHWEDARAWLQTEEQDDYRHLDSYLNARCSTDRDDNLIKELNALDCDVMITQGFIAKNQQGETVLLGRGGSDSSATYFASQIGAEACEIWTDVPGIYTANPKQIPEARLITRLDYDEAQEIASMGAKVLHPKCISPMRRHQIPLHIRYTPDPSRVGTDIYPHEDSASSHIKSILIKNNIILISIETVKMWHQVGFLVEVFSAFKKQGISIDLISTSEASVTVSLDSTHQGNGASRALDTLLKDLNKFARAKVIAPCASVSLVGRNIRAILHKLGEVFSVFEEQQVHLVTQAANDLNLTFVVDEDQAPRLAAKLHHLLIEQIQTGEIFHLSFEEEFGEVQKRLQPWWEKARNVLLNQPTPSFIYSEQCLQSAVDGLKGCDAIDKIFYSIKANNYPEILKQFYKSGIGFESVSLEELNYLLKLFPDIERSRIIFTPNFAGQAEYAQALKHDVLVTVDNLYPLENWPTLFKNKSIFIRVDIGKGSGHHKYVVTGGDQSKFGIPLASLDKVKALASKHNIKITGLHSHAGSGILNPDHWQTVFSALAKLTEQFTDVSVLNIGGGLGVVERPGQQPLDLTQLNHSLQKAKSHHPDLQLWMEPGRYLVAEAGVLLAKVTQVKNKGELHFVGIETGMNSLIRPALYGSYHEIVNLTRLDEPKVMRANVVGPICETGDTLGYSRWLPVCREGDVMLIATVGAYGRTMSSCYNLRDPAIENFLDRSNV